MNNQQNHQSLIEKYNNNKSIVRKLNLIGGGLQICNIICIGTWKLSGTSYYEIGVPFLLCLAIYFFVKDLITVRRIEGSMVQMVLEGVALEDKNRLSEKVFHRVLESFNFTRILIHRTLTSIATFWCIGYFIIRFIEDMNPDIVISQWFLSLFILIPSLIAAKLYYDSLEQLEEAKEKIFAKSSF